MTFKTLSHWEDERGRLFSPQGAIMKIVPDPEHWLCYGVAGALGAVMSGSSAYLSRRPVSTAARFAGPSEIRVAGLLWPEARERWAHTAYLVSERRGNGPLILFADDPAFRGFFLGTERLLLNAMLLGPGCGRPGRRPMVR